VEQQTIRGLEQANIASLWAPAAAGPWFYERLGPDGRAHAFLAQVDGGRCVFLRDDGLCAVHALLGPQAKPGFCREFPYNLMEDPDGLVAVIRPDCGGFFESFADGEVLTDDDVAHVEALPRVIPRQRWAPSRVEVLPGHHVEVETWLAWEPAIQRCVSAAREPGLLVAELRAELARRCDADLPEPVRQVEVAASRAMFAALHAVLSRVLSSDGGAPHQVAFTRARFAQLEAGIQVVGDSLPLLHPQSEAFVALNLRSFLLSKQFAAWGSVADGVGCFLLGVRLAQLTAGASTPEAFAAAWTPWHRFTSIGMITQLLRRAGPALRDLFLHTGAVDVAQ